MRGKEALPLDWLHKDTRAMGQQDLPFGSGLTLFMVLNHSCRSPWHCCSPSTGIVVTPSQPLPGTENQVTKDVRDREKKEKQTESFAEFCCRDISKEKKMGLFIANIIFKLLQSPRPLGNWETHNPATSL